MADANFYLRDTKALKDTGVILFFSYNGKRIKIGAVDHINPTYWNKEKQRAKQSKEFATHAEFNQGLQNIGDITLNVYRRYLNDNNQQQPSPDLIKELIKKGISQEREQEKAPDTLFSFIDKFIEESKNRINDKTGKPLTSCIINNYRRTLTILKDYARHKQVKLNFDAITLDFYLDFKEYLSYEMNFSTNTVGKHVKTLKTFLNDATDRGINTNTEFRRKRFKVNSEAVENIYLDKSELDSLFNLDLSKNKRLERVRDLFLIGCWTGLRFSDFNRITSGNIIQTAKGRLIEIETQKTRQKVVIPVNDTVETILERYNGLTESSLPPPISNVNMNKYLKDLGKLAELNDIHQIKITKRGKEIIKNMCKHELITTHTARRSFASNMYLLDVPSITIMAITGHRTEKAFLKYIKVPPREHAEKMREIWNRASMIAV